MKKIIILVLTFSIVIFVALWFFGFISPMPKTIKIISPKDGITISTGSSLEFDLKIRGNFTYGGYARLEDQNGSGNWNIESHTKGEESNETIVVSFPKAGVYKMIAYGQDAKGWSSETVAVSNPITVNVVGREAWQTIGEGGLFSMQVPGEWHIQEQSNWNPDNPNQITYYEFYFFDTDVFDSKVTPVFTIIKTPTNLWNHNIGLVSLAETSKYVFSTLVPNTTFSTHYGFNDAQIREVLPKIFSSFKLLKP